MLFAHLYPFTSPLMSPCTSIDAFLERQRYTSGVSKIYLSYGVQVKVEDK
jgi:hypothetical protein